MRLFFFWYTNEIYKFLILSFSPKIRALLKEGLICPKNSLWVLWMFIYMEICFDKFNCQIIVVPTMSFSFEPKKVKPKGNVQELKLVHSINHHGSHIIKTEEVKTPKKEAPLTSQHGCSFSPIKRQKLEAFDNELIPFILEGADMPKKRQTLIFLLFYSNKKQNA